MTAHGQNFSLRFVFLGLLGFVFSCRLHLALLAFVSRPCPLPGASISGEPLFSCFRSATNFFVSPSRSFRWGASSAICAETFGGPQAGAFGSQPGRRLARGPPPPVSVRNGSCLCRALCWQPIYFFFLALESMFWDCGCSWNVG